MERIPGIGPGPSPWQGDALPLRHIRMEPARRIELRLSPYHCDVLPLPLSRHELGKHDSDVHRRASKARRLPVTPFPIGAPTGCYPRLAVLTGNARTLVPGASCARRDLNPQPPGPRPGASACWATSTWSRPPVPIRASCLTGAGPQAVRGGEATGAGIGPACSCFRDRAGCQQPTRYRVRKARVERASARGGIRTRT